MLVTVDGLSKSFGDRVLWEGIDGSFESGDMISISGPSGSGKSTLLNCLGLLESPSSGRILAGDAILTGLSRRKVRAFRRMNLGYLFQNYALVDNSSAVANVRMACRRGQGKDAAFAALDSVGLTKVANAPVYQLSGGEQQRVALARLLVRNPKIILADEPTGALDAENTEMVLEALKALAERGSIIFLATHSNRVISSCSEHIDLGRVSRML